jgi:hypothetical protein
MRRGELEEARQMLAELEAEATARGDEQTRVHVVWYRSIIQWLVGDWQLALQSATEAYDVGEQSQFPNNGGFKGRVKALIEADLGLVEEARASAQEAVAEMDALGNDIFSLLSAGVLGRLELALGNSRKPAGTSASCHYIGAQ